MRKRKKGVDNQDVAHENLEHNFSSVKDVKEDRKRKVIFQNIMRKKRVILTVGTVLVAVVFLLVTLIPDPLRAQNYNKIWSSTDDFNTGTNSNIDTAGDQAQLATTTTSFSEGFTSSTYKDAATNANWDTSTHKLTLPGDPTSGVASDLQTEWDGAVGANKNIMSSVYDSANNLIYLGGSSGSFAVYNVSTGVATNLTPKISTNWSTNGIYSLTFDSANGRVYLGGEEGKFGTFNGGSDPANGIWTNLTSKISSDWSTGITISLTFDSTNNKIYLGSYSGKFGVFTGGSDPANGTWVYLTAKISSDWGESPVNALTFDSTNGKVYLGGNGMGAFTGGSDPANGTWVYLYSKMSSTWSNSFLVKTLTFDSANGNVYAGGEAGRFGVFTGGSDPANGDWNYLTSKISSDWSVSEISSVMFAGGKIFLGGGFGKFGIFTGGSDPANGTWNYLNSNISSINGENQIYTMTYVPSVATLYLGAATGKFTGFLIGYTSNKNGISTKLNSTAQIISRATITATASTPTNTAITYYLSNDGGSTWHEVTSGTEYSFAAGGSDLRWKANLTTTDASITPEVTAIAVSYKYFSSNTGTMDLVYDATQTVVPTKLSWNNTLPTNTTLTFKVRSATTSGGLSSATWSDTKNAGDTPVDLKTINVGSSVGVPENQFTEIYVTFNTTDGLGTPVLSDVTEEYVINAAPELQNLTASQSTNGSKIVNIGYQLKDSDTHNNPYNQDKVAVSYQYSVDSGSSWHDCTTVTNAGLQTVNSDNTWKSFTSAWNAGTDLADQYYAGTVKIKVLANDNEQAHNIAEMTSSAISLDTTNPTSDAIIGGGSGIQINSAATWTNSARVNLVLSSSDDTTKYMEVRNDSSFVGIKEAYSPTKTNWDLVSGDGNKTVYVRFYDAFGNYTDASANILLDTTAPDMPTHFTLFDGSDMALGTYQIIAVWNRINDPGDFSQYSLERSTDGSTWTELATFSNISSDVYSDKGLSNATTYSYRLKAKDIHANNSTYSDIKSLNPAGVDTVPPEITGTGPTPEAQDVTATISWTTDKPSDSYVEYGTTTNYGQLQGTDNLVVNHSVTLVGLNPTTTYQFRVKCRDAANNRVVSSNASFTTTLPAEASAGVNITGATAQKPGADPEEVTIIWTTDRYSTGQVFYGTTETALDMHTDEDSSLNKTHYVAITHLNPNTKYYYKAYSKDTYDNDVWGELKYFITAQSGLASPAVAKVQATDTTMNSTIISWQTTTVATSVVEIGDAAGIYDKHIEDESTGATTQHVIRLSDLQSGKEYHYRVLGKGTDERWVASDDYMVATVPVPVISDLNIKEIKPDGASVIWKTNSPTDSYVDYGTGNLDSSQGKSDLTVDHLVTLSGLKAATNYKIAAKSRDAYGNIASSSELGFTTTADVTAPKIDKLKSDMSLFTTESGDSKVQAVVTWATDEPATTQLKYSDSAPVNGYSASTQEEVSQINSHVVILNNLKPSTTYHMQAISRDGAGNITASKDYVVLTKRQEKSLLQTIISELETTFGWVKKIKLFSI